MFRSKFLFMRLVRLSAARGPAPVAKLNWGPRMRLLLVEDDAMIGESIEEGLRGAHYVVDWVRDGAAAELALELYEYDLVVLDLALPKKNGLDVLRSYRRRNGDCPVLIVTARDSTADRVVGLDGGADDYLVKPVDLDEMLARIRALVRRHSGLRNPEIRFGGLVLNPATRATSFEGKPLHLSSREYSVLEALLNPPGNVISKARLQQTLYGWVDDVDSNTVEVYIHQLRRKIRPEFIQTVRGVGYRVWCGP